MAFSAPGVRTAHEHRLAHQSARAIIHVRSARFERTPVMFLLKLKLYRSKRIDSEEWQLDIRADGLVKPLQAPFMEWLGGKVAAES
jgi:hypothetical protein